MSILGVKGNSVNVSCGQKKNDEKTVNVPEQDTAVQKPSKMKKIGRGAASAIIPGAGQVMNGEYKKAGWILIGSILLPQDSIYRDVLRGYAAYDAYKNTDVNNQKPEKAEKTENTEEKVEQA